MLPQQVVQPSSLCESHHRDQTGRTDQVRVIENRGYLVRCLHLSDAPSDDSDQTLSKSNPPAPQGHSHVTTRPTHPPIGGSGLNCESYPTTAAPVRDGDESSPDSVQRASHPSSRRPPTSTTSTSSPATSRCSPGPATCRASSPTAPRTDEARRSLSPLITDRQGKARLSAASRAFSVRTRPPRSVRRAPPLMRRGSRSLVQVDLGCPSPYYLSLLRWTMAS